MEPLAKLVVSFIELAETELAMLKTGIVKLCLALAMVIGAGILGVIGLYMVLHSVFLLIEYLLGNHAGALAISGVIFLAVAGALVYLALRTRKQKKLTPASVAPDSSTPRPVGGTQDASAAAAAASMRIAS
ncbi:MAG TPA: phage holin family protein [Tepidisphaeraceae bacterium]|jgi:hypothetical protein